MINVTIDNINLHFKDESSGDDSFRLATYADGMKHNKFFMDALNNSVQTYNNYIREFKTKGIIFTMSKPPHVMIAELQRGAYHKLDYKGVVDAIINKDEYSDKYIKNAFSFFDVYIVKKYNGDCVVESVETHSSDYGGVRYIIDGEMKYTDFDYYTVFSLAHKHLSKIMKEKEQELLDNLRKEHEKIYLFLDNKGE